MTDLTTSLVLSLRNSQFTAGLRSSARQVDQFTNSSSRQIRGLKQDFQQLTGQGFGRLKGELLGLAGGFAAVHAASQSANLDKQLTQIGLTAGVTTGKTAELRKELFALQRQYGVVVDESRNASGALLAAGLGFNEARGATQAIAPASAVTGAQPEILAGALSVSSEIFGYDLARVEVATDLLDKMTVAGRAGNAELEDLASIFARVGGNAQTAGLGFEQSLGFIEQLSLIERQPERLATLADSTLRIFTNQKYLQNVQSGLGINFYGEDGQRRDPFSVLGDISAIYQRQQTDQQRDALVSFAFGETDLDTQRGIRALLQSGKIDEARATTREILAANGTIARELDAALNNAIDQSSRLKGALRESVDSFVQPLTGAFNDLTRNLLDSREQGGLGLDGNDLLLGAGGLLAAGGAAYRYGPKALRGVLGKAGGLGAGVATGMALEAATGVQPVYVVNMPSSFGGGPDININRTKGGLPGTGGIAGEWIPRGSQGAGRLPGKTVPRLPGSGPLGLPAPVLSGGAAGGAAAGLGTLGTAALWAGGIAAAAAGGYGVGTLINDHLIDGTEVGNAIGRSVANVLALFGNDTAKAALESERRQLKEQREQAQASLKIEVSDDGTHVKHVESRGIDFDVSGASMSMM
ncbi:phage tail tape measure protein [Oceanobacter kriegii]|uniref:phage tail tape measure protein n=1 Tax=Oceanobacter kriegii TaxID=64972 RepID=UPI0003F7A00F|nr:phage tail tape measure protein [Oceanobacter kriegii]